MSISASGNTDGRYRVTYVEENGGASQVVLFACLQAPVEQSVAQFDELVDSLTF